MHTRLGSVSGHRRSVRLASADYGAPGLYVVTLVTAGRTPLFSRLGGGRVALFDAGQIAHDEWLRTGDVRASVAPDAFVVMPDHVHLLFGTVATVMRQYKSAVTKQVGHAVWQRGYHDRIVRTAREADHVRRYIAGNPRRTPRRG